MGVDFAGEGQVLCKEQDMLCTLLDIGCGSAAPVIEFAAIGIGVAFVITLLMRNN
jgi:hypothetical protein